MSKQKVTRFVILSEPPQAARRRIPFSDREWQPYNEILRRSDGFAVSAPTKKLESRI